MNTLLLKDLLVMRGLIKTIIAVSIILVVIFMFTGNLTVLYFLMMIFGLSVLTSINFDVSVNWDKFVLTAPVKRNDVVKSKYIIMTASVLVFLALSVIITAAAYFIADDLLDSARPLTTITILAASTLITGSASIPAMYKFGPEISRYIITVAMFIVAGIFVVGYALLGDLVSVINTAPFIVIPAVFAVCALVMFAMYKLACGVYGKKEF